MLHVVAAANKLSQLLKRHGSMQSQNTQDMQTVTIHLTMQERAEVVKSNRDEVEGLFEKRSSAEQAFLERYMAAAEAFERQLEELRCTDAEDYNLLKVRSAEHLWGCTTRGCVSVLRLQTKALCCACAVEVVAMTVAVAPVVAG